MLGIESLESRRLLSTGQLDLHFGDLGTAEFQYLVDQPTAPSAMATLADGRTLVVGNYYSGGATTLALFTADGRPDSTFGDRGVRALPFTLGISAVLPAPDGSVYLVSRFSGATVARLTPSLALDPTWGEGGVVTHLANSRSYQFRANAAVLLGDGSIFIAGEVASDIYHTRILPTGQLDPAYPQGYVRFRANRRYADSIASLTLLADGNLLASGRSAGDFLLWKIKPNGKPVAGFGDADAMVVTDFGPTDDMASSVVVLADGSVVAGGTSGGRFALARYTPRGNLLRSFGHRGRISFDLGIPTEGGARLLLAPQGRLVLVGTAGNHNARTLRVAAASFQPRGQLDRTFGEHGKQFLNFDTEPGSMTRAISAVLASAGDILVNAAGYSASDPTQIALFHLTAGGQLDPTFGDAGVGITAIRRPADATAKAIGRQSDGKIVTLSSVGVPQADGTFSQPLLTRFNPDGSVDLTFGDSGSRLLRELQLGNSAGALLIDAQDRIYIAGRDASTNGQGTVLRLTSDGRIDPSFGEAGFAHIPIDPEFSHNFSLALQGDRLVLAANNQDNWFVFRFELSGVIDATFASAGRAQIASPLLSNPLANLIRVLVDGIGRITLVGRFHETIPPYVIGPTRGVVAVARLTPSGELDPAFGNAGIRTTSITGIDSANSATLLPDGRIALVAESYEDGFDPRIAVLVYRSDGSLDESFADTGIKAAPSHDLYNPSIAYVDGKLIVAAMRYRSEIFGTAILRYNLDGTIDSSFAKQGQLDFGVGTASLFSPLVFPQPNNDLLVLVSSEQTLRLTQILSDTAPAPTAQVEDRILRIRGTSADDIIILRRTADHLTLLGDPVPYPLSELSGIEIEGLAGNDLLDASQSPVSVTLIGGDGNDSLLGGAHADLLLANAGHDTLFGGSGNDNLHGNTGNDYLSGGPGADDLFGDEGNDQFHARDNRTDLLHGGPGHDRATHDLADLLDQVESSLL